MPLLDNLSLDPLQLGTTRDTTDTVYQATGQRETTEIYNLQLVSSVQQPTMPISIARGPAPVTAQVQNQPCEDDLATIEDRQVTLDSLRGVWGYPPASGWWEIMAVKLVNHTSRRYWRHWDLQVTPHVAVSEKAAEIFVAMTQDMWRRAPGTRLRQGTTLPSPTNLDEAIHSLQPARFYEHIDQIRVYSDDRIGDPPRFESIFDRVFPAPSVDLTLTRYKQWRSTRFAPMFQQEAQQRIEIVAELRKIWKYCNMVPYTQSDRLWKARELPGVNGSTVYVVARPHHIWIPRGLCSDLFAQARRNQAIHPRPLLPRSDIVTPQD